MSGATKAPESNAAGPRARDTSVVIREFSSLSDFRACAELQRQTWGEEFGEVIPPSLLKVVRRVGGVAAGAYGADGDLLGFVFGITGVEHGRIVHWSHMLGVLPRAQNRGIGRRLKEYQRAEVAKAGGDVIYWTFDPLVARNAHLNLNVLGASAQEYVRDMYGEGTSPLHRGIGTDRLVVAWAVSEREAARSRERRKPRPGSGQAPRIEIPADITALQLSDMGAARMWRETTRAAFETAFASGRTIMDFQLDETTKRGCYLLTP